MARPKKDICEKQVLELAKLHCTTKEIAAVMDCSVDTLDRRFAEVMAKGREMGKMKLRRYQWKLAETNPTIAIWLGKQYLGQRDQEVDDEKAKELVTNIISYAGAVNRSTKS